MADVVTIFPFFRQSSPTYRRIKRQEHPRIRDRVQYIQTQKIVLLREPYSLKLSDKMESEFRRLPEEYSENPRSYEEFIEKVVMIHNFENCKTGSMFLDVLMLNC